MGRAIVAGVLALVVAGSARAVPPADAPLAIFAHDWNSTLVRVDPGSLRPIGSRLALASVTSWSFSPNRSRLALGTLRPDSGGCGIASLRVVDPTTLRTLVRRGFGPGALSALAWLRGERLVALREGCTSGTEFLVVDTATARIVAREKIDGTAERAVTTSDHFVALVTATGQIGPARLVVLGPTGETRSVALAEIFAGHSWTPADSSYSVLPALASAGHHAYVIPAGGPVAEVDLDSLRVSYHRRTWRHAAARAKASEGTTRHALRVGELIAVFGRDDETFRDGNGRLSERGRPAGLELIDRRTWSVRRIDDSATWAVYAAGRLLVTRYTRDSSVPKATGMGVAAYGLDGQKHFHLFPGRMASVALVHRDRVYVQVGSATRALVVDGSSGRGLGWRTGQLPRLLLDQASNYWRNGT